MSDWIDLLTPESAKRTLEAQQRDDNGMPTRTDVKPMNLSDDQRKRLEKLAAKAK